MRGHAGEGFRLGAPAAFFSLTFRYHTVFGRTDPQTKEEKETTFHGQSATTTRTSIHPPRSLKDVLTNSFIVTMNTNNTTPNKNKPNMPKSYEIEARMQTVQASLRQERDKARRDYELAMERLGLLRVEVEATNAAAQDREKRLTTIMEETKRLQAKVPSLRETVQHLTKEVRMQLYGVVQTATGETKRGNPLQRATSL